MKSNKYNLVAENPQSTVVGEYVVDGVRVAHYQSEADLERAFIKQLETQAYEYLSITSEADLVLNLRKQLENPNARIIIVSSQVSLKDSSIFRVENYNKIK